jgi:hypothetical protein
MNTKDSLVTELKSLLNSIDELSQINFSDEELETTLHIAAADIEFFAKEYAVPSYHLYSGLFKDSLVFIAGFYVAYRYSIEELEKTKGSEEYLDNLLASEEALKTIVEITLGSCLSDLGIEIDSDHKDGSFYYSDGGVVLYLEDGVSIKDAFVAYTESADVEEDIIEPRKDYTVFESNPNW